jgi:hypothetical protein
LTGLGATVAHAASFQVTNLDDAGPGSLRDAIAAANSTAGADVISFAPGVSGTIKLSSGQLTIRDSLQVVGPGRGALTVDGSGASRVFDIPLSPGDVGVSISGLTVSNGSAPTGGGIRVQDESLTLDDVALIGNKAVGNGGGLFAEGFAMTLNVRNSTISGNSARGGGGVYIEDTKGVTVLDGVVIDGNTASEQGGGIFFYDPDNDVVINNATITNNAARKGGGIYMYSQDKGSFTISNSSISGNKATTGGGIYLYDIDHPVSISNTTISGNTAANGAGINIDRISTPAVISNSTISGNTATGAGGGVRLARGGGLSIAHSTITANSAADAGGARFPGPVTLSHVIVAGNTAGTTADLHAAGGVTSDFSIIGSMIGAVTDGGGNHLGVADPMLASLADNGGRTLTHLPRVGSPAIDAGNPAVAAAPATDQRGMPRIAAIVDIGAVETQGSTIQFDSTENTGTITVTVTRTGSGDLAATVEIATADGTAIAPGDYGAVSTNLSWTTGETGTKTINIPVVLDAAHESDESFTIALTKPTGATLGTRTSLTVALQNSNTAPTITDITNVTTPLDKPLPAIAVAIADAEQPATALTVTATSSNQSVVANSGITITGAGPTRSMSIAPLAVGSATITVTVSDGRLSTSDTFNVAVTAPIPTLRKLSVCDVSIVEGNSGTKVLTYTVTLDGPAIGTEKVAVATSNGTATASSDYVALPPTVLSFATGQTSKTVSVTVNGDTTVEPNETLNLVLSAPVNATITKGVGVGTITNDDAVAPPPNRGKVWMGFAHMIEGRAGTSTATYTIYLDHPAVGNEKVTVTSQNGTATAGSDYVAFPPTVVSFAAGKLTATVKVIIKGDQVREANETINMVASNPVNVGIARSTGTITIANDD